MDTRSRWRSDRTFASPSNATADVDRAGSDRAALVAREIDAELLELPVQVRAFEAGLLGDACHAAVFLRQVELEVALLERVARLAERPIEVEALLGLRAEQHRRQRLHRAAGHGRLDREGAAVVRGVVVRRGRGPRRRLGEALLDRAQELLQRDRL